MKKCLVIDDVEVTRFTSEQIITSLGLGVVVASNEQEAMEVLNKDNIDYVFLDWHLRKESGLDVLKKIKSLYGARIKVAIFSAVEAMDKKDEAMQAGADAFLEKPTTKEKVQSCLKNFGAL